MRSLSLWLARNRVTIALPFVGVLMLAAQPAAAAGDPQAQVDSAASQLHQAQAQASAEDDALAQARSQLAAADARLAALHARIASLDAAIRGDSAHVQALQTKLAGDRGRLSSYLRTSYEQGGPEAALIYLFSANSIAQVIERKVQLDHVAVAVQNLVATIRDETQQASATLAAALGAKAQLQAAQQQAQTEEAVIAVEEGTVAMSDVAAHAQVAQAKHQLSAAQAALAAAQAAARRQNTIYPSLAGGPFTVNTDLTKPSGETAARLNGFLQGTDLAGLGQSFMNAEAAYHVSARYFVAHAILESDWGASAIAQDKHNLFGFNADDSNPYGDATTFPSFDACIQYVAHFIEVNYLLPTGPFYHGPTLLGMNVDYASDPDWAYKIAAIADTIP